jgi:hypothetical protein
MLKDLILSYEKWANTVESVAEEAGEISKQLEQCRVCHFSVVYHGWSSLSAISLLETITHEVGNRA